MLAQNFYLYIRKLLLVSLLMPLLCQNVLAETFEGIVHGLDLRKNSIVISDMTISLSNKLKVYNLKGKPVSAFNLTKGTPVRVQIDDQTHKAIRIQIVRKARF